MLETNIEPNGSTTQLPSTKKRGRLKIFLGFAAGVGKTCEMLTEANRRRIRGQDVVIGYLETHGRAGTIEQIGDLEIIPRKKVDYRNTTFEEMDTDAIIARNPQWALVDELAHTNVPGSLREKRWQDVELLRDAGISVTTTLNVQHLESLNDSVHDITGVWVRETVPDSIVHNADEVQMVDITPRALLHRLERGDIYIPEKVAQARNNWFREKNLNALREIALRQIAEEVDDAFEASVKQKPEIQAPVKDRIMVCISPDENSMRLIRRGYRVSQRLHGELVAVYVEDSPPNSTQQAILKNDFTLADRLGIPVVTLQGDVAEELIRFSQEKRITQIVIGHSDRSRWREFLYGSIISRLTRELRNVDILIVAPSDEATKIEGH